jgi:hypothetical protein
VTLNESIRTNVKGLELGIEDKLRDMATALNVYDDRMKAMTLAFQQMQRSSPYGFGANGSQETQPLQDSTHKALGTFTNPISLESAIGKEEYVGIPTSVYRPRHCGLSCPCSCHGGSTYRTPRWLSVATGDLSFTFSGIPNWTYRSCNDETCSHRGKRLLRVTYYFPSWCLHRMISYTNSWDPCGSHTMVIRTARVISPSADIFAFAQQGYIDGLKALFKESQASPFDISAINGRSALNVSQVSVIYFLMQCIETLNVCSLPSQLKNWMLLNFC